MTSIADPADQGGGCAVKRTGGHPRSYGEDRGSDDLGGGHEPDSVSVQVARKVAAMSTCDAMPTSAPARLTTGRSRISCLSIVARRAQPARLLDGDWRLHQVTRRELFRLRHILGLQRLQGPEIVDEVDVVDEGHEIRHEDAKQIVQAHDTDQRPLLIHHWQCSDMLRDNGVRGLMYGGRGRDEIKFAKSGEIDSLIRELALREKATLMTADVVQSKVAEAKGIPVFLYTFPEQQEVIMLIEKYFSKETMSIHLKEGCSPMAKIGKPGDFKYTKISEEILSKEDMQTLSKDIVEKAKIRPDSFFEMDRKGSTVLQVENYRIVIVRPPFSDGYEITAVRPVKTLLF